MGRLIPDQARAVAMGGGPQLPLPRMAGLEAGPGIPTGPGYTLQVTGAPPPGYAPQMTGGSIPPMGYQPQLTGAGAYPGPQITGGPPRPPMGVTGVPGYAPQMTGAAAPIAGVTGRPPAPGFAPQMTGGYAPQVTGGYAPQVTGFPPVTAEDMSRYKAQFSQLDRDGDGLVQVGWVTQRGAGGGMGLCCAAGELQAGRWWIARRAVVGWWALPAWVWHWEMRWVWHGRWLQLVACCALARLPQTFHLPPAPCTPP